MIQEVVVSPDFASSLPFSFDISYLQQERIDDYLVRHGRQGLCRNLLYTLWIDTNIRAYEGAAIRFRVCDRARDELFNGKSRVRFHIVAFKEWEQGD